MAVASMAKAGIITRIFLSHPTGLPNVPSRAIRDRFEKDSRFGICIRVMNGKGTIAPDTGPIYNNGAFPVARCGPRIGIIALLETGSFSLLMTTGWPPRLARR